MIKYGVYERGDIGRGLAAAHRICDTRLDALLYARSAGLVVAVLSADGRSSVPEREPRSEYETSARRRGFEDGAAHRTRREVDRRTVNGYWYARGYDEGVAAVSVAFYRVRP